jgi:hypothetical protein
LRQLWQQDSAFLGVVALHQLDHIAQARLADRLEHAVAEF